MFLGIALGLLTGAATGLLVGVLDMPEIEVRPEDPLEYEWLTPVVLFVVPFWGGLFGAVLGGLGSVAFKEHRVRALVGALGGLAVGVATGWRFRDSSEFQPVGHLLLVCFSCGIGATLAVALAPMQSRKPTK